MEQYSFEKLLVYQKSRELVVSVYKLTDKFPDSERFALCSQIKRSVTSVPSNIAEQSGRTSIKEKKHFIEIAYGSLMETFCQLQIAEDLRYISEEEFMDIKNLFFETSRMLSGLKRSLCTTSKL